MTDGTQPGARGDTFAGSLELAAAAAKLTSPVAYRRLLRLIVETAASVLDAETGSLFLVDEETWAIRYLVVDTSNWWFGHKVLISPQWISGVHWSDQTVSVDLNRAEVKDSPPYDPSAELDRQRETGLYTHYARPPYWKAGATPERHI